MPLIWIVGAGIAGGGLYALFSKGSLDFVSFGDVAKIGVAGICAAFAYRLASR